MVYAIDFDEVWKDVADYEGFYQVSNLGRVRSMPRTVVHSYGIGNRNGMARHLPGKIIAQDVNWAGYHRVTLKKSGSSEKVAVHRLVANAFVQNTHGHPQINHKDENPHNNMADNLEWCTNSYNINYGTRNERASSCLRKPVAQYDMGGNFIETYVSASEAKRKTGCKDIVSVCSGKRTHSKGYKWEYV